MKVSVMMITYNHERFIAQAIESVLAQRVNFDYEIVIGEDCSTDGTRAVIMDFHRRYPSRIVPLLREKNIGGARNIELTLAACRGQYVAMLEGDDYWTCEEKLQRQVDFLDANPDYAICCHRVQIFDEIGTNRASIFPSRAPGTYTLDDLLKGNFIMTGTTVFRRNSLGPLPPQFQKLAPLDWTRLAMIARHGKIELMDDAMAVYRMHSGSIWSSMSRLTRLEESSQMLETLDKQLGYKYTSTIRKTLCGFYLETASIARQEGKRLRTAKYVISCIRKGGWHLPDGDRLLAGLAAYALIGSLYRVFSKAKSASDG